MTTERKTEKPSDRRCAYCADQAEPGRIETDNNGPIVDCPVCRPDPAEILWRLATCNNPLICKRS